MVAGHRQSAPPVVQRKREDSDPAAPRGRPEAAQVAQARVLDDVGNIVELERRSHRVRVGERRCSRDSNHGGDGRTRAQRGARGVRHGGIGRRRPAAAISSSRSAHGGAVSGARPGSTWITMPRGAEALSSRRSRNLPFVSVDVQPATGTCAGGRVRPGRTCSPRATNSPAAARTSAASANRFSRMRPRDECRSRRPRGSQSARSGGIGGTRNTAKGTWTEPSRLQLGGSPSPPSFAAATTASADFSLRLAASSFQA